MMQQVTQDQPQPLLLPEHLLITSELEVRPSRPRKWHAEAEALYHLARIMVQRPTTLLDEFVRLAVDLCDAGSAGVSLLETTPAGESIFRWAALGGAFASYVGGTTPRNFSPCGMCLDRGAPIVLSKPGRVFTYFNQASPEILEGLIVPLYGADRQPVGTIWIVSHDPDRTFCREDARTMEHLGEFTVLALQVAHEAESRERLFQQLTHRTKNILSSVQAFVLATRAGSSSVKEYSAKLNDRLRAMGYAHDLLATGRWESASLRQLVHTVLHPTSYSDASYVVDGDDVLLNERACHALAMALDELATNACKYGALSVPGGMVELHWRQGERSLKFTWEEKGGPPVVAPERFGFGSKVIEMCLEKTLGGHVTRAFPPTGFRCEWQIPMSRVIGAPARIVPQ
jgi:two-component sensor histidine kinase